MAFYTNFIGIDIGKRTFVVAQHKSKQSNEYSNDTKGIQSFLKEYKTRLINGLCVLENTGGYEYQLLYTLCNREIKVHRANAAKVKFFIRSFGNKAKTDKLDAKALALYAYERNNRLECFSPQSSNYLTLYELVQRRQDLKKFIVAEKNRCKAPRRVQRIEESCKKMVEFLSNEIKVITEEIDELIAKDAVLKAKVGILKSIPGIGNIIAFELLILLPELGSLNRREIASLAGLAPRANDSGQFNGYRSVGYGRNNIKPTMFLAAMAARSSNSTLKLFYERLLESGKKKMVALTALMRKLIVIANARIKEFDQDRLSQLHSAKT